MKKIIISMLLFTSFTYSKVDAQTIYSDVNFLKANICLFATCNTFDAVYKAENQQLEGEKQLAVIKNRLDLANKYYLILKVKYSSNKDFKLFEQNIQVMLKCYNYLKENDNTWALAFTLVKMNLDEMVNSKIK